MRINFPINQLIGKLNYFRKNNWIFTVLIFLSILVLALLIWRDCILYPQPSEIILSNILKVEQEYDDKMAKIKQNNKKIESQIERFNNPQKDLRDRKYFKQTELEVKSNPTYTTENKAFNPQIVR